MAGPLTRPDGSVLQAGMRMYSSEQAHMRMHHTLLGVILDVYCSDDPRNRSAIPKADFKGSRCEANVLCVHDIGVDDPWIIPNVVILPRGSSGMDNYYEELPKPSTQLIDGTQYNSKKIDIDNYKLDGDFCVIAFLGGQIEQPYMLGWWPHPGNDKDASTSNASDQGYLLQGRRLVRRFQGTKLAITSEGSLYIDTCEANFDVSYNELGINRKKVDKGGDIRVAVKPEREFELNFNLPVNQPEEEPDLLQPNPPRGEQEREDTLSRLSMNKDFINAVAGRVVQIMGNNDGTDRKNTVLLGQNPDPKQGHLLLGERVQATFNALVANVNSLRDAYEAHFHASGNPTAPTSGPIDTVPPIAQEADSVSDGVPPFDVYGPPTPQGGTDLAEDMPNTDLSEVSVTE